MPYYLQAFTLFLISLTTFSLPATVTKQLMTFVVEEVHNGTSFKHLTDIENGSKKESFFVNNKSVGPFEYEDTLLNAQKEETKKERKKTQEDRIRMYETQYKARVKIAQSDLKQALSTLENELVQLADERIKPFIVYKNDTVSSADQTAAIKEKLIPDARKLAESSPDIDIKKINDMTAELRSLIARVHETFVVAVNNGINKADDTKLLKELLTLL